MPTDDITALSDDDAVDSKKAGADAVAGEKAADKTKAVEDHDDEEPLLPAEPGTKAKKTAAKAKAAVAKPAAAKTSDKNTGKPSPKAKSTGNPKAKSGPKTQKAKSKGSKEPAKAKSEKNKEEADTPEEEPAPMKKPAGNVKKRPAANLKPKEPEIRAYKYRYHDKQKWGVRIKGGSELITVRGPNNFQWHVFFEEGYFP